MTFNPREVPEEWLEEAQIRYLTANMLEMLGRVSLPLAELQWWKNRCERLDLAHPAADPLLLAVNDAIAARFDLDELPTRSRLSAPDDLSTLGDTP